MAGTASAPDILSRREDHEEGVQDDNKDQILLKLEYFKKGGERIAVGIEGEETEWVEKVKKEQDADKNLNVIKEMLRKEGEKDITWAKWNVTEEGLLLNEGRIVVPDTTIRQELVKKYHTSIVTGHLGKWKTYDLLQRQYWWPQMAKTVERVVRKCDLCQRTKTPRQSSPGKLMPIEAPVRP